eukprot:2325107-Prymnesium_polylepis.1
MGSGRTNDMRTYMGSGRVWGAVLWQTHAPPFGTLPPGLARAASSWWRLNPDYTYKYFDDRAMESYVRSVEPYCAPPSARSALGSDRHSALAGGAQGSAGAGIRPRLASSGQWCCPRPTCGATS